MADEVSIEVLAPERLEEMRAEELEKLRAEVDTLVLAVNRREWRDFLRTLNNPLEAPIEDAQLPIMRNRLVQRRAQLVAILSGKTIPQGVEDDWLDTAAPEDSALTAVKVMVTGLFRIQQQ